jgi:glycosyltransferase involved in cell wall biosynthesis
VCIVRQTNLYEPQLQRVAEALVSAGFDVELMCMRHPERPRTTIINGVRIISLPAALARSSKLRYALDYVRFFVLAAGTLAIRHLRRRYVVVQIYTMPDFLVFAAALPKLLGARVIAYMNEPSPELFETLYGSARLKQALAWVEQRVLRFADHAITVTDQLKRRYVERGARADRIGVVLNAADPSTGLAGWSPPQSAPNGHFTVMSHGAIEDRYGQDTIIEAARRLRAALPDLRVVFTGKGSEVDRMLSMIKAAGLEDIVRFEGWVSVRRLNDLLHTADVGIVAQKASSYSHLVHTYKMVDYWIFGLPVIASRLRAVSELYDETVIEYYEAGDADDLARAIQRLHDDSGRREQLSRNGRLAHDRHGWAAQRETFLGVYDGVIGDRNGQKRLGGTRPGAKLPARDDLVQDRQQTLA